MSRTQQSPSLAFRLLILGLVLLLGLLQTGLWLSEDGWSEVLHLRRASDVQRAENANLTERNARLRAEVADLKGGFAALEERARADLGMVADDESFYLLVPVEDEADESSAPR